VCTPGHFGTTNTYGKELLLSDEIGTMKEFKIEIFFSEKEQSIYKQILQNCKNDNISL